MRHQEPILYGEELGRRIGILSPQAVLLKRQPARSFAITRLTSTTGRPALTERILPEKGFTISVHLTQPDSSGWKTCIDGALRETGSWETGGIGIYDLESDPRVVRNTAFDTVHYNIPRSTLEAFTEDAGLPAIADLHCIEGARDHVLLCMSQLVLPIVMSGQIPPDLFHDHFLQMLCGRLVSTYSRTVSNPKPYQGGLAPWQKRRTLEILEQHLSGDLRLSRLAKECGISASYFSRCFRTSFGTSVHRFVIRKRVERAKELLVHSRVSMAQIAVDAGFSDQAAFSRTFSSLVGIPPAKWRTRQVATKRRPILDTPESTMASLPPHALTDTNFAPGRLYAGF